MRELVESRQNELDIFLEEGTYIILPKSTGCTLKYEQDSPEFNHKI
jgi:hypothetical protein